MRVEFDERTEVSADEGAAVALTLPARVTARTPWSERYPGLYPVAVTAHQLRRHLRWLHETATRRTTWTTERSVTPLAHRVKQHKSLLLRTLGESEMWLQHNKVTNLTIAAARVDTLVIRPGETFSFNKVVGNCTRSKGYVEGMRLSNGAARPGVGGGICQLANLLHWMVLHSALTVVERSEHSFDPFPDHGRVLPWGVGCSIVYNYVDLVVRNDTESTFQLFVHVGERYLEGDLRVDREQPHSFRVAARGEQFLRHGGQLYRRNEIWRTLIDRRTGDRVAEELVKINCASVRYEPGPEVEIIEVDDRS